MKKSIKGLLVVLIMSASIVPATAATITIGFAPQSQSLPVGSSLSFDVTVADLVDSVAPALAAFDIDMMFDPTIIAIDQVSFGPYLGGPAESISIATVAAGMVRLTGVSLLPSVALVAMQPDTFSLATVNARANAAGTTALSLNVNSLSDESASPITFTKTETGSIRAVPEPMALLLLSAGVGLTAVRRKRLTRSVSRRKVD